MAVIEYIGEDGNVIKVDTLNKSKAKTMLPVSHSIPKAKTAKTSVPGKVKNPPVKQMLKKAIDAMIPEIEKEMGSKMSSEKNFQPKIGKPFKQTKSSYKGLSQKERNELMHDTPIIDKSILKSRIQASLSVQKAIHLIEGYIPIDDAIVSKSFNGLIPDTMKEIEFRPPETWWNKALAKSIEFESNPAQYSMELWYGIRKANDEKICSVCKEAICKCEENEKGKLSKAVAEPLNSKNSPQKRKSVVDFGGESEVSSNPTTANPSDIAGKDKSETTVTN